MASLFEDYIGGFNQEKTKHKNKGKNLTMRVFNSFQLVCAFVAWPFLIQWLQDATFKGATAAFYSACVVYFISFCLMIGSVYNSIGDE